MRSTKAAITITKLPSNTCFWGNFITTKLGEFHLLIVVLERERGVMFGNNFCFLFSKFCFWGYEEKTVFLYF